MTNKQYENVQKLIQTTMYVYIHKFYYEMNSHTKRTKYFN